MSNSSLAVYKKLSPNCSKPRNQKITKITIHHMAGNLTIERCGELFAAPSRKASSNYGIGSDGRVGLYVEEANRSWCSGNADNDNKAITIEVANDGGAPDWHVSDKALTSLIELCVDICKRNGIQKLNFTGNKNGNLTMHSYFQATACPGPYLKSKFQYIADEVNKRLGQPETKPTEPAKPTTNFMVKVTADDLNIRKGPGTNYAVTGHIKDHGTYTIVEVQNTVWGKLKSGAGWICLSYTKRV